MSKSDCITTSPETKYPVFHRACRDGMQWLQNLLRLYDPTDLSARDLAFINAELDRYLTAATESEELTPLVMVLRDDLERGLDTWRHKQTRARYQTYLKSEGWDRTREKVMQRAGYVCEGCRERRATQVHHLNYDDPRGEELLFNLVALCAVCHKNISDREGRR